jgi:hypothetical protein
LLSGKALRVYRGNPHAMAAAKATGRHEVLAALGRVRTVRPANRLFRRKKVRALDYGTRLRLPRPSELHLRDLCLCLLGGLEVIDGLDGGPPAEE